jgi:translation elongation factor EF-Ts
MHYRLEKNGEYDKAAALALFHGNLERAIKSLSDSRDEHGKKKRKKRARRGLTMYDSPTTKADVGHFGQLSIRHVGYLERDL